jgi:hypothetical protein
LSGGGDVDFVMVRDDVNMAKVKKSSLMKFGVEGVHYFNYINRTGKVHLNELEVVNYFVKHCQFKRP